MKQELFAVLLFMLFFVGGCTPSQNPREISGPVKVKLPWFNEGGNYSLQVVEIKSLTNIREISGQYAKFYMSPRVESNEIKGPTPLVNTIETQDGVFVPSDTLSAQVLSVYAHIEKLAELDYQLGFGEKLKWPLNVGIKVLLPYEENSKVYIENNALYYGPLNALLVVPYTQQDLPIAVNGGVLAHEHFHDIFNRMVLEDSGLSGLLAQTATNTASDSNSDTRFKRGDDLKEKDKYISLQNSTVLRAINEGIADFWGYLYSNDVNFISHSLPEEGSVRGMGTKPSKLISNAQMEYVVKQYGNADRLSGFAYTLGTDFSRYLKALSDIRANEKGAQQGKQDIAKMIVSALPNIKEQFLSQKGKSGVSPSSLIVSLVRDQKLSDKECELTVDVYRQSAGETQIGPCKIPPEKIEKEQTANIEPTQSLGAVPVSDSKTTSKSSVNSSVVSQNTQPQVPQSQPQPSQPQTSIDEINPDEIYLEEGTQRGTIRHNVGCSDDEDCEEDT